MSEDRDWPPRDWAGELRVGMKIRNPDTRRWTTYSETHFPEATRDDWDRVETALLRLASSHAGARMESIEAPEEEPEPGHPGPGTGHS